MCSLWFRSQGSHALGVFFSSGGGLRAHSAFRVGPNLSQSMAGTPLVHARGVGGQLSSWREGWLGFRNG